MTKVFISYSHDSQPHKDWVRSLADQLRTDGIESMLDQYVASPEQGWLRWMQEQVEQADFVLLVCTPTYLKRYNGQEQITGKGVNFEGVVISQLLYDTFYLNKKFIPVILTDGSSDHIPLPLKAYTHYCLPNDYTNLYRYLTNQPAYPPPPIGTKKQLHPVGNNSNSAFSNINSSITPSTEYTPPSVSNALNSINTERRKRLEEKLRALYKSYDLETRVEEKMRLEAVIADTDKELKKL